MSMAIGDKNGRGNILVLTFVYLVSCQFFDMENKTKLFKIVLYGFSLVAILLTSVGRMFSLMQWFTDVLGGILLGIIENLGKAYISTQLSDAIVFSILIIVLLVKPSGLLGKNIQEKV